MADAKMNETKTRKSLHEVLRDLGRTTESFLSAEGKNFLATVDNVLTDHDFTFEHNWGVKVLKLSSVRDSQIIVVNDKAIAVIMAETNLTDPNHSVVGLSRNAFRELDSQNSNCKLISTIVITPEDYTNANKFANYIRDMFTIALANDAGQYLTMDSICKDSSFTYRYDIDAYEEAYRKINPHAVPLRHDLCLTVYAQAANRNFNNYGRIGTEADTYLRDNQSEKQAFATIGGYVEFLRASEYEHKYLPIVHISEISAAYPDCSIVPLLLSIATREFIFHNGWQVPYRRLQTDAHGNVMYLGALFPSAPNISKAVEHPEISESILATGICPAQLVLDVTEGRATLPGLIKYGFSPKESTEYILQSYANFFGCNFIRPNEPITYPERSFFRGYYSYGEKKLDSANIDYISEYSRHPNLGSNYAELLVPQVEPASTAAIMRKFEPDLRLYYRTQTVGFDPRFFGSVITKVESMPDAFRCGILSIDPRGGTRSYRVRAEEWGKYMRSMDAGMFNA